MIPTESQLRDIEEAFDSLDFSKPKAHELYRELADKTSKMLTDIKDVSSREFRFYALGSAFGKAEEKMYTNPPVNETNHKEASSKTEG